MRGFPPQWAGTDGLSHAGMTNFLPTVWTSSMCSGEGVLAGSARAEVSCATASSTFLIAAFSAASFVAAYTVSSFILCITSSRIYDNSRCVLHKSADGNKYLVYAPVIYDNDCLRTSSFATHSASVAVSGSPSSSRRSLGASLQKAFPI